MSEPENGFSLKELLIKYMSIVDALKTQYDTQSTAIYEKSKENSGDINALGKKLRVAETQIWDAIKSMEGRIGKLELRVYAAAMFISAAGFILNLVWK